jgi:hypothetical protein
VGAGVALPIKNMCPAAAGEEKIIFLPRRILSFLNSNQSVNEYNHNTQCICVY